MGPMGHSLSGAGPLTLVQDALPLQEFAGLRKPKPGAGPEPLPPRSANHLRLQPKRSEPAESKGPK